VQDHWRQCVDHRVGEQFGGDKQRGVEDAGHRTAGRQESAYIPADQRYLCEISSVHGQHQAGCGFDGCTVEVSRFITGQAVGKRRRRTVTGRRSRLWGYWRCHGGSRLLIDADLLVITSHVQFGVLVGVCQRWARNAEKCACSIVGW